MGKKIASNESSLENISIKSRPMNVSEDYNLIVSNEWLDAKVELDKLYKRVNEKDKLEFLCNIIKVRVLK